MQKLSDQVFYEIFIIAVVITWSPLKALAYVAPFLVIAWLLYRANSGNALQRLILCLSIFCLIIAAYYVFYLSIGEEFLVGNAFISLLMYSPFLCLLVVPAPRNQDEKYGYERYAKVLVAVLWIQSMVGVLQYAAAMATPVFSSDAVQGTISPLSFLADAAGFGNQMFAINLIFTLLYLLPYVAVYRRGRWAFLAGLVAVMLALVVHAFIALLISVFVTVFLFRENLLFSQFKIFAVAIAGILLLASALAVLNPQLVDNTVMYLELYEAGDSPRSEAVATAINQLPEQYPTIYFFGLGPGQFSSRAGLISSGYYFGGFDTPQSGSFLPHSMSKPFREFVLPLWRGYSTNVGRYGNSTMSRPYFSVLSVYVEFGLVFLGGLGFLFAYYVYRLRSMYLWAFRNQLALNRWLALATGTAIVFLVAVSFFENYLETTQAIFPGLLLIKKFYTSLQQHSTPSSLDTSHHQAYA